jgi:hypothetical protein
MIDFVVPPIQTSMTGPKAVFGSAFRTTKYGSNTFAKKFDHHKTIATMVPSIVPEINPIIVS